MISTLDAEFVLEMMKEVEFPKEELRDNNLTISERKDLRDILRLNPEDFPEGFTEEYSDRINEIRSLVFKLHEDAKEYKRPEKQTDAKTKQYNRLITLRMLQEHLKKLEDMYYHIAFHKGSDAKLSEVRKRILSAKRKIIKLKHQ